MDTYINLGYRPKRNQAIFQKVKFTKNLRYFLQIFLLKGHFKNLKVKL